MFGANEVALDAVAVSAGVKDLPNNVVGLYCGGAGDIVVTTANGRQVTFKAVPLGVLLPIKVRNIVSATATNLVALLGPGK